VLQEKISRNPQVSFAVVTHLNDEVSWKIAEIKSGKNPQFR
jgi:hypothetical protein